MRAAHCMVCVAVAALALPAAAPAASILIVNNDGAGEGFNDLAPRAPVPGNPGVTLGQQRLNVFNAAAAVWGTILKSSVQIRVASQFNPLFCDASSALLGSAGANTFFRDYTGRPVAATWYAVAEANSHFNADLDPGVNDITAQFNSFLDGGVCLGGATWWYGIGSPPVGNTIDLFTTVLHELAHGLGNLTIYDPGDGSKAGGFDDAYLRLLRDESPGENWSTMTNAERFASQTDTGNVSWIGSNVNNANDGFSAGVNGFNRLLIYAPSPHEPGSSISHWATGVTPNELMEPFIENGTNDYITYRLMKDIGWSVNLIFKDGFRSGNDNFWSSTSP